MKKEIGGIEDLNEGQMKEINIEGHDILLSKVKGKVYAMIAKCSHVGAPLADGVLNVNKGRVRCPWHQACFDIFTGELEEPPAINSLPLLEVNVENEKIFVNIPDDLNETTVSEVAEYNPSIDKRHFVVMGGGAAGSAAVETMRQAGFRGKITMISAEDELPYNRTQLSKSFISENQSSLPVMRSEDFYRDYQINLQLGKKVERLNHKEKTIIFEDGSTMGYDRILLATGSIPRKLNIPGSDLENILTLRSGKDAKKINKLADKSNKAVIVGASFIGMETAASLADRGLDVSVVAPENYPYQMVFGDEIGKMYKNIHEENGVNFELNSKLESFSGERKVETVNLKNGKKLAADFVLVGIGVRPNTAYLDEDIKSKDGSVKVDEQLRYSSDLFAAGDIARYKDSFSGKHIRIEHWRLALQHGRIAGFNMAGKSKKFNSSLFFWTRQYGFSLQYVGYCDNWDEIIYWGDVQNRDFISFYIKNDRIKAAAGCGNSREMGIIAELMERNNLPEVDEIRNKSINFNDYI